MTATAIASEKERQEEAALDATWEQNSLTVIRKLWQGLNPKDSNKYSSLTVPEELEHYFALTRSDMLLDLESSKLKPATKKKLKRQLELFSKIVHFLARKCSKAS